MRRKVRFDFSVMNAAIDAARGISMEFDEKVLQCFLDQQGKLFPEPVAETWEEAEAFLEDCDAQVVKNAKQVWQYFQETGVDLDGADEQTILDEAEVFAVGDGRYLIVEG